MKLHWSLMCSRLEKNKLTGNPNLINIFDQISYHTFPIRLSNHHVITMWEGAIGESLLQTIEIGLEGKPFLVTGEIPVKIAKRYFVTDQHLKDWPVPKPGTYQVTIRGDGLCVYQFTFDVIKRDAGVHKNPTPEKVN